MKRLILSLSSALCIALLTLSAAGPIRVRVDMEPDKEWTIDPKVFGSFSEEHWGDITPGIYEQYVLNPSFEDWYKKGPDDREKQEKSPVVWQDIPKTEGLAFPWERLSVSGNPVIEQTQDAFNTDLAQRMKVSGKDTVYLYQRLALPFYRVKSYNVSFYAKVSGNVSLKAFMTTKDPLGRVVEKKFTVLSDDWSRYDVTFHLPRQKETIMKRYGIFNLGFEVTGTGTVDIDQVTLFPTDCHDGVFNPETIAHFRNYGPTMMRWPGGNFTSGYHWYDGIGPVEKRKSLPNRAWGGLCTNHVGIDEFMRFCELTDIIPVMGVGFDEGVITPDEVARWVEYCNGDVTTEMGALRAQNGHPEPYGVKYWGLGNEVYGSYQIGHTDVKTYAKGLVKMVEAIRKVDKDVEIIASAYGLHNAYQEPSDWTKTLVDIAGDHIDYLDVHAYVYGPRPRELGDVKRPDVIRAFAASNFFLDGYIDDIRKILKKQKKEHIKLAFLEWGILPSIGRGKSTRVPHRQTFVNMLCTSAYFNEFIRNGDFVKMGAHHNFSFYVAPVRAHAERVNPRTLLFKHYSMMAGGTLLDVETDGMPTYDVMSDWKSIGSPSGVPEVDILAVRNGRKVYVTLMNRNHHESYSLDLSFLDGKVRKVSGSTYTSQTPFEPVTWQNASEVKPYIKKDASVSLSSDTEARITIPKISYTLLIIELQ